MDQMNDFENSIWRAILRGHVDAEWVWEAHEQNLREVLKQLKMLLDNFEADKVVITADHGNAIGEWGLYGHGGPVIKAKVEVPWIEASVMAIGSYEPDRATRESVLSNKEQLKNLGYLS